MTTTYNPSNGTFSMDLTKIGEEEILTLAQRRRLECLTYVTTLFPYADSTTTVRIAIFLLRGVWP